MHAIKIAYRNTKRKRTVAPEEENRIKRRVLSFPVVIDDVALSTWLICCRRALSRRIITIILGHFPLTFEYFHSKFNNFKALGKPLLLHLLVPSFSPLLFSWLVVLYSGICVYFATCACRTIGAYFLFLSKFFRIYIFKSKRSATKPNTHSCILYMYIECARRINK